MDTSVPAKFGMDAPAKMMPHTSSTTNHAALRAHMVSPCEPGRPMNTEQTQTLRPLQELVRCAPTQTLVLRSPQELARCAPSPAQMLQTLQELARCTPPQAQRCERNRSWARRPHAYLAPLLTDECRSTVGPKGWEPQQCVLTCVS